MKDKVNVTVRFNERVGKFTADTVYMGSLLLGTGVTEIEALDDLKGMLINKRLGTVNTGPRLVAIEF